MKNYSKNNYSRKNSQKYKKNSDSNFSKIARMGGAAGTNSNTVQGSATLTILEILQ